jgi:hypothetical protein
VCPRWRGGCSDAPDPGDLGRTRRRVRAVRLAWAARAGQVRDQVPGGVVGQGAQVGGSHDQPPDAVRPAHANSPSAGNAESQRHSKASLDGQSRKSVEKVNADTWGEFC